MKQYINGEYIELTETEVKNLQAQHVAYLDSPEGKYNRIMELKQLLANTDYVTCKIAEGAATKEEYQEILNQRQEWRDEINKLEIVQLLN